MRYATVGAALRRMARLRARLGSPSGGMREPEEGTMPHRWCRGCYGYSFEEVEGQEGEYCADCGRRRGSTVERMWRHEVDGSRSIEGSLDAIDELATLEAKFARLPLWQRRALWLYEVAELGSLDAVAREMKVRWPHARANGRPRRWNRSNVGQLVSDGRHALRLSLKLE